MTWIRYGKPTNCDNDRLMESLLNSERALAEGPTVDRFPLQAQRVLRDLGGAQTDEELLATITDDGGAGEARPVGGFMRARAAIVFQQVMARLQLVAV